MGGYSCIAPKEKIKDQEVISKKDGKNNMNRQEVKTQSTGQRQERNVASGRPPEVRRKKPDPALLRLLRGGMLLLSAMIVVVGALLLILPMFHVQNIEVEGNSYHSAEEIIAASEIVIGQEVLAISKDDVCPRIYQKCKYVDSISIVRSFNKVKIVVTERKNVMYTEFNGKYYSLDRNFRVLEETSDEAAFSSFLKVKLPTIASLTVGGTLCFENEETDRSYITELIDTLEKEGVLPDVTSVDFSKKYSVSYVLSDTCRVEIGKVSQIETKLLIAEQILQTKGGATAALSVLDVSDLQKPTYRVLGSAEMLLG